MKFLYNYVIFEWNTIFFDLNNLCLIQGRRCGFPGYFPRGRIQGRSYLFGDEIYYSCLIGYELRGNPRRICNANGKWSGLPPVCIGKDCTLSRQYILIS